MSAPAEMSIERESLAAVEASKDSELEKSIWRTLIRRQGWRAYRYRGRIVGFPPQVAERLVLWLLATVSVAAASAVYFAGVEALYVPIGITGMVSTLVQVRRPPRALALAVRGAVYAALAATAVFGVLLVVNPSMSDQTANTVAGTLALANTIAVGVCLLGLTGAPPGGSTIPACLGLLVVGAFGKPDYLDLREMLPFPFAFAVLWLVASGSGARLARGAGERPSLRGLLGPAVRLTGQVALAAGIALSIAHALPVVQGRIDQGLYDLAGRQGSRYSGFTRESRLGDLASLKLSDRIVLRVYASTPQYLRGRVFSVFDGKSWRVKDGAKLLLPEADPHLPMAPEIRDEVESVLGTSFTVPARERLLAHGALPSAVVTQVVQTAFVAGTLVAPGQKALVRAPVEAIKMDAFDNLEIALEAEVETYATVNRPGAPDPVPPGAAHLAECAQLPARGLDARFAELARRISSEESSVEERIARTTAIVMAQCTYSLEPGAWRTDDPVAEFFFEKRKGYCQYFASAAALLLRAQKIPCRYVSGFAVSADNMLGGHYVVREHDAHAWLEAYIEGRGWVEVDATPGDELESLHARVGRGLFHEVREWVTAKLSDIWSFVKRADLKTLVGRVFTGAFGAARFLAFHPAGRVILIAIVLVALAIRLRSWRRKGRAAAPPRRPGPEEALVPGLLGRLLADLDRTLARRGVGRPPARAPLEHLRALPAKALPASLLETAHRIVDAYYAARFAGRPPAPESLSEIEAAWRSATKTTRT